jgi:hypothetical protein
MARQTTACRWCWCPGCGRERHLARGRTVMRGHNRWAPATRAMVWCEGSGQPPRLNGHTQPVAEDVPTQRAGGDEPSSPRPRVRAV